MGSEDLRRGRARRIQDWLRGRGDTSLGRLALQWFRAYFAASRNSGCAVTVYSSLSVLPAALVFIAAAHPFQSDVNVFAQHVVTHMKLTGSTATLVENTFGSTSSNTLAASLAVVVSFLLWGIGIGQIYQDVYARAWGVEVGSLADQGLFALFFFILAAAFAAHVVLAERFGHSTWLALAPAWIAASTVFWLFVPSLLLHRKVGLHALLPGALVASVVIGGSIATSPLWIGPTINQNGKAFGSFGVVLTLIGYVFVLFTMTLVCAVFSPVWRTWRESVRLRSGRPRASRSS